MAATRTYTGPLSGDSVSALKHSAKLDAVLEGDSLAEVTGTTFKNDWNSITDLHHNDIIFAFLTSSGGDITSLTDNDPLTWVKVTSFNFTDFAATKWISLWRATVPVNYSVHLSDGHVITIGGGASLSNAVMARVRNLNTVTPTVQSTSGQAIGDLTLTFGVATTPTNHVIAFQAFTSVTTCTIGVAVNTFGSVNTLTNTDTGHALTTITWSGYGALGEAGIAVELNG